jgi:hypothetical protein
MSNNQRAKKVMSVLGRVGHYDSSEEFAVKLKMEEVLIISIGQEMFLGLSDSFMS